MIVEDEVVIVNTLKAALRHLDVDGEPKVYAYCDPIKAAQKFEKVNPDLIILDYMMPNLTGMEFLEAIKWDKNTSKTKVILYTAYNGIAESTKDMKNRVHRVVQKPSKPVEFLEIIKEVLKE